MSEPLVVIGAWPPSTDDPIAKVSAGGISASLLGQLGEIAAGLKVEPATLDDGRKAFILFTDMSPGSLGRYLPAGQTLRQVTVTLDDEVHPFYEPLVIKESEVVLEGQWLTLLLPGGDKVRLATVAKGSTISRWMFHKKDRSHLIVFVRDKDGVETGGQFKGLPS